MFALPEAWVWDFWFADDGERHHMFFLYASRALHDPDARHYRASIGHAVSEDLVHWTRVTDALVRADAPAFDDLATWTGSVVRHPDGTWFLFYTGSTLTAAGNVQRIGYATSSDLMTWHRSPDNPVLEADPRWYETLADGQWHDEAFRDPWVFRDPDGDGWHMLVTARGRTGPADDRGVVGHAWSPDLRSWELRPPLTEPGQGFGQLEVMQVENVDGVPVLLFSCLAQDMAQERSRTTTGGVWAAPAASALGPFDVGAARQLTDSSRYSGRLVRRRDGQWVLLAFDHDGPGGEFVGTIGDPIPVATSDGLLTAEAAHTAC
ncbi:family 43 glycosylhydrolase [Myceligenerans indicum]|uniref:Family 43 glycosylhydrolase n=1 Tax=Myceligenerans indicum TaxID=2593663 RepID=A0ABS1LHJ6_9MICO|nr:family 43 glycosylhydrolase [Myceligenerans indicum]MBL0885700.1 family 43 glycosylhydrolase [Myceligenerans indicum]